VHAKDTTLSPTCCCGLEDWRDWLTLLDTGQAVWWGHSPDGHVELLDASTVRTTSGDDVVDLPRGQVAAAVRAAGNDLTGFLDRLREWL